MDLWTNEPDFASKVLVSFIKNIQVNQEKF